MTDKDKNQEKKINIEIDEKTSEGIYSNLAIINHSVSEFVVDFVTIMPGSPKAKVRSRVILTPEHAKRLQKALGDNIKRFENSNGEIKSKELPPIPLNFGPTGEA
ncbi:MAG: hypothetical protein CMC57_02485 [Flavobacteriaceae bacterium]|nr:hypothetical protein [Flavobacteriaceae bacterium]|tara:strand:- start:152 stop:466 length:315 start_codon:yes stop_codon:yes gene_type:complete